jgi:hypothetical protein
MTPVRFYTRLDKVPKICVPRLVDTLHASIDLTGQHFLDNVDVGGVTWKPKFLNRSLHLLMAFLNSTVLRWFFPQISAPFRGGFRSANRQFLSLLPIAPATPGQEASVVRLVDYLLWLNRHFHQDGDTKTSRDALMLGYYEQVLNGLVYELYFPEELRARGLRLFDLVADATLPDVNALPETERLARLRSVFERLYDLQHPIRAALHDLQTVEEVRIIEGKA